MKLSRTVSYALQAVILLAGEDSRQPVPCNRLAADGNLPERFLLQILRTLVSQGVLVSTRGVDGGYCLARPAEKISLLEVIEAIDGPLASPVTFTGLPPAIRANLERAVQDISSRTRNELAEIKLSDIIKR
jgi:Rrf2 family protein